MVWLVGAKYERGPPACPGTHFPLNEMEIEKVLSPRIALTLPSDSAGQESSCVQSETNWLEGQRQKGAWDISPRQHGNQPTSCFS